MDTDGLQFANPIDNLTYLYDTDNKNLLLKVTDDSFNPQGFKDGTNTDNDYSYDDNGNLTKDKNKQIEKIKYNHLNLPTQIIFVNGNKILYLYNAVGQKVRKSVDEIVNNQAIFNQTDYLAGFQYHNTVLKHFPHAEGYVNASQNGTSYTFNYVFNYTDHLGNIRLSYTQDPTNNVLKIIEENHYYPFGLKHSGYNSDQMMYIKEDISFIKIKPRPALLKTDYNYKYNGKEWQDELGLNMYDYGARNYDPAIGRWMNIDPLAEVSRRFSPYTYALNNPIFFIDPDGMRADWIRNLGTNGTITYTAEAGDSALSLYQQHGKADGFTVEQANEIVEGQLGENYIGEDGELKSNVEVGDKISIHNEETTPKEKVVEKETNMQKLDKFVDELNPVSKLMYKVFVYNDASKYATFADLNETNTNAAFNFGFTQTCADVENKVRIPSQGSTISGSTSGFLTRKKSNPVKVTVSGKSKTVLTGPRGGKYYINKNGNKTYLKKDGTKK